MVSILQVSLPHPCFFFLDKNPRLARWHTAAIRNIDYFSSFHTTVIFILVTLGPQNGYCGSRPYVWISDIEKGKKELKIKKGQGLRKIW